MRNIESRPGEALVALTASELETLRALCEAEVRDPVVIPRRVYRELRRVARLYEVALEAYEIEEYDLQAIQDEKEREEED